MNQRAAVLLPALVLAGCTATGPRAPEPVPGELRVTSFAAAADGDAADGAVDYADRLVSPDDPVMGKPAEAQGPGWRRFATVYGWLPNFKGDVGLNGSPTNDVHLTRSDMWNNLDFAYTGRFELQEPGREWSVWMDLFYAGLEDDDSAEVPIPVGPGGSPPTIPGTVEADVEVRMTFIELGAILHALHSEARIRTRARGKVPETTLDLLAGARYGAMHIDFDAELTAQTPAGAATLASLDLDETERWVDPFVGLRVKHLVTPRFGLILRADVGGFKVGSDFVWNVVGTFQYAVAERVLLGVGWRTIDLDYESTSFEADVRMGGPFVTITYEF